MTHVRTPGKLLIAGEWAITEPGYSSIVAALDKFVHVQVEPSEHWLLSIDDFNIKKFPLAVEHRTVLEPLQHQEETRFVRAALSIMFRFLDSFNHPLEIHTWGETHHQRAGVTHKIGFGSSASATVGVIAAVLQHIGYALHEEKTKELIFKLAFLAHFEAQGHKGSGFDVAASTYGGVIEYKPPEKAWIIDQLKNSTIPELASCVWPGLFIQELGVPEEFRLLVGWTGTSASTRELLDKMQSFKSAHPEIYQKLFAQLGANVEKILHAWKKNNKEHVIEHVRLQENYLRELTHASGVPIETPLLKTLSDTANTSGGAGKLSGAGGGDCGIAICFDTAHEQQIKHAWTAAGIHVIPVSIVDHGVSIA